MSKVPVFKGQSSTYGKFMDMLDIQHNDVSSVNNLFMRNILDQDFAYGALSYKKNKILYFSQRVVI